MDEATKQSKINELAEKYGDFQGATTFYLGAKGQD
jgi:hypothetical protein